MKSSLLSFISVLAVLFSTGVQADALETIQPGVVRVAVTGIPEEGGENAPSWTLDYFREFERAYNVTVEFVVVPFDKSWELPGQGEVDIVATGVTAMEERQRDAATFSQPYLQVKRGLRIHAKDSALFHTIHDFIGYRIGAVEGMTSAIDLINRAPEGVQLVLFDSWEAMYDSFYAYNIHAVAEGYYVSVDPSINHSNTDFPMIDDHDLVEGEPEYLVFVVRNRSTGILEAVNNLLDQVGFPVPAVPAK